jgi:hypothetical protein
MLAISTGELPSLRNYVEPDSVLADFSGLPTPKIIHRRDQNIAP